MQQNAHFELQTFCSAITVGKWRLQTHSAPDFAIVRSFQPPPGNDQQEKRQKHFSLRQEVHPLDTLRSENHRACVHTFLSLNAPNYNGVGCSNCNDTGHYDLSEKLLIAHWISMAPHFRGNMDTCVSLAPSLPLDIWHTFGRKKLCHLEILFDGLICGLKHAHQKGMCRLQLLRCAAKWRVNTSNIKTHQNTSM